MPFLINPRVVDLRRELHLCVAADKANQGDRCSRVNEMGGEGTGSRDKREYDVTQILREGARRKSGTRITEGALNGKFSGKSRLKWNVPPLYGLSAW